jgi:predicted enzyme related to lactoylglutathione lyase
VVAILSFTHRIPEPPGPLLRLVHLDDLDLGLAALVERGAQPAGEVEVAVVPHPHVLEKAPGLRQVVRFSTSPDAGSAQDLVETGQDPRSGARWSLSTVIDMNEGMKTVLFPVSDIAKAKAVFRVLMGEPANDAPYYVGYDVDGLQIGLVPNGHSQGMPSTVCFWHVDDIESRLQQLVDAGAEPLQPIRDVGGGRRTASVKDADGNAIGLIQDPA